MVEITHRLGNIFDKISNDVDAFLCIGEKTFTLSLSRGRNTKGEKRWFVNGTGQRCMVVAETVEMAILKAKVRLTVFHKKGII